MCSAERCFIPTMSSKLSITLLKDSGVRRSYPAACAYALVDKA